MNTNQGERMDQVRIAELRLHEKHLRASGQMVGACLGECLDAIESAQTELATAREVIEESMEARRTSEAEGGALNHLNNEIDRLRAKLAALRGQVGRELTVEEYDENAPLRNMAPLAVRVPRLPVRPEAHPSPVPAKTAP